MCLWVMGLQLVSLGTISVRQCVDSHKLSTVYIPTSCSTYILNNGQKLMNILEKFCMDCRWVWIAPKRKLCPWRLKARINHILYTIRTLHLKERNTRYYAFENICNGEGIKYWVLNKYPFTAYTSVSLRCKSIGAITSLGSHWNLRLFPWPWFLLVIIGSYHLS